MSLYHSANNNNCLIHRHPPTATLLSALLPLQLERRWMRLEEEGAFVIVSAESPYYILWATKKWSKVSGLSPIHHPLFLHCFQNLRRAAVEINLVSF